MKRLIGRKTSMAPSAPIIKVKKEDSQDEILKNLERIFSAGSSIDALKIFYAAEKGIESSTRAIKELGLTKKRYYTNLKRLIDVGLVEKTNGRYAHTTLGKIVYKLMEALKGALHQKDKLDLIDKLLKVKSLTMEETQEIMKAILKGTNIIPSERLIDMLGPVRMSDSWEKVVNDVIEYIDKAEEEILFASRYYDIRVMESLLKAAERGVRMYFLINKEIKISNAVRVFLSFLLTNHESLSIILKILNSPKIKIRYIKLPYTFLIVDGKYSMVEVPTPLEKRFSLAFFFHDKKLSQKLLKSFNKLWKKGSDVDVLGQIGGYRTDFLNPNRHCS